MYRWDGLVEAYLKECRVRGLAVSTLDGFRRELEHWGLWLKRRRPRVRLEQVGQDLILHYLKERTAFRAKATVSSIISVLRGVGQYLVREGYWRQNPLRWIQGPKLDWRCHLPRRISPEAMQSLWEQAGRNRQKYYRCLWVTILSMLYGTGIRRGELHRLNLSDWIAKEGILVIDGNKIGCQRRVVLPELTCRCLEVYLVQRHNLLEQTCRIDETALFINRDGRRLRLMSISRSISCLGEQCGLGRITLHQFRHTCASDLLADGLHVAQVQKILGHQSVATTMRYLHISGPERIEAVKKHPINEILSRGGQS